MFSKSGPMCSFTLLCTCAGKQAETENGAVQSTSDVINKCEY